MGFDVISGSAKGVQFAAPTAAAGAVPSALLAPSQAVLIGIANFTATIDPGPNNDASQGYTVGAVWFNQAANFLRWWECRDDTVGAAKWVYSGADYANGGSNPASEVTAFGQAAAAAMAEEGNIYRVVSAGTNPGGTGADYVLATFALPANCFDISGRGITVTGQGAFSTDTDSKRLKILCGGTLQTVGQTVTGTMTVIADTGTVTVNGSGWSVQANIFKYGAIGSNTQLGIHQQCQTGGTVQPLLAPTLLGFVETAPIYLALTGNAATDVGDIVFNFFEVNAMN